MLRKEFTQYKYRHIAQMRSTHGIRLYELLTQWRQIGEREPELDDLKRMFGIEGRYRSIRDLKRYVIEPAVRDVNECSDLRVEWGHRKAGRRVVAIRFRFRSKPNGSGANNAEKGNQRPITRDRIQQEARPGETWEATEQRLSRQMGQLPSALADER